MEARWAACYVGLARERRAAELVMFVMHAFVVVEQKEPEAFEEATIANATENSKEPGVEASPPVSARPGGGR